MIQKQDDFIGRLNVTLFQGCIIRLLTLDALQCTKKCRHLSIDR